jgi:prepilin-type N-terminal cleavage/methylation domain-containing protein
MDDQAGGVYVRERGFSLFEVLIVVAIVGFMAAVSLPNLRAYLAEAQLMGAGQTFVGEFRRARSIAAKRNVNTAIRFEKRNGVDVYSTYVDGNRNGVTSADISTGVDFRIAGPHRLDGNTSGVRVGINPGTPAPPPDSGLLDPADPIRFGASNMLSFSPLGTASPGTFYLAGDTLQAGVRVTPGSSRVRLMLCRGGVWVVR